LLGLVCIVLVGITIRVFVDVDALAICRFVVAVLFVIGAPPPLLLVVGLGLIPVLPRKFL